MSYNPGMRLFKRGKTYHVTFKRGVSRSLRTQDPDTAKEILRELQKAEVRKKLIQLEAGDMKLFEDFKKEYLAYRKTWPHNTYRADRLSLEKFQDFYGNRPMVGLTGKKLELYRAHLQGLGLKSTSCNNYIRHLKIALKKANKWGYIKDISIMDDLKIFKVDQGKPIFMNPGEINILFETAQDYGPMALAIPVMICTGLSRSDVCKPITITDTIIQYRRKKTGRLIEIPIIDKLRPYIKDKKGIVRLVPWNHPDTVGHKFLEVVKATELKGISAHKVRHTFATLLLSGGVDIATVSKLLGHSDISITTKFYGHIVDNLKRSAMEKFNAILG